MNPTELKSNQLLELLINELGNYRPGERFLTVRQIMFRFSVSQLIVDKALIKLCRDGLLESIPRRGLFIPADAVDRNDLKPTFLVAVPDWVSSDIDEIALALEDLSKDYPENRLLLYRFDYNCSIPAELPLKQENVKGLILLPGRINTFGAGNISALEIYRRQMPVVVLCHHLDSFGIASVGLDDTYAGNMAVHHLSGLGHRKIGILVTEPPSSVIRERVDGIINYGRLNGIQVEVIDCGIKGGDIPFERVYHTMEKIIKHGFDFTALVGISSDSIAGALNACHNYQVDIPGKLGILTIGNARIAKLFHPPLDVVSDNLRGQIKEALILLGSGENRNIHFHPELVTRGSVVERGRKSATSRR